MDRNVPNAHRAALKKDLELEVESVIMFIRFTVVINQVTSNNLLILY